jgi:creatinine amidohydrolase
LHLPYGTDVIEGQIVGEKICEEAWRRGAKVVLLPTIPYGTETNMRGLPLAMNVNPSTLFRFVADLVESLADSSVHKLLILNSHGGNEMKPLLRELAGKTPVHLFLSNWYKCFDDQYDSIFSAPEDHAGEMETSFGLAYFPQLVARDDAGRLLADEGRTAKTRFEAVNRGWVSITRPWPLLTTNTGSGNPHAATAEKGEKMMQVVVDRLAGFLVELCRAQIDERFPF